jgi:hypothetical protein
VRIRTSFGLAGAAAAMALVLVTPATLPAQTPSPAPQTQAQQPPAARDQARNEVRSPIQGALVSVDAEAKKITIKPAEGDELEIAYTDTTEISGAQKDAAGLATMSDARVTVHFTEAGDSKAKTATRIIVQPKQ